MPRPTRPGSACLPLHWGGGCPWCSAAPSPTPSGAPEEFLNPLPRQRTDLRGAPWPGQGLLGSLDRRPAPPTTHARMHTCRGSPRGGPPADSQTPPSHLSCRLASPGSGSICCPPRFPVAPPSCQRTHSPPSPDRSWVAAPSRPLRARPSSTSSSGDWTVSVGNETTKAKPDICNYLSVCTCRSHAARRPAWARAAGRGRRAGLRPRAGRCCLCPDFISHLFLPSSSLPPPSPLPSFFLFSLFSKSSVLCLSLYQSRDSRRWLAGCWGGGTRLRPPPSQPSQSYREAGTPSFTQDTPRHLGPCRLETPKDPSAGSPDSGPGHRGCRREGPERSGPPCMRVSM